MSRKEMKRWFEGRIEKVWPERDRGRGQRAVEKENERKFWSRKTQWGNSWKEEEESEIKLSWDFGEKRNNSALYWATCTEITSLLYLMIYSLHINFFAISFPKNQDMLIPKILEKKQLQRRHLLVYFYQKMININLY